MLVLAGAVLAITLFLLLTREREPAYQGQSLTQWLMKSRSPQSRPEAEDAIRHIGTNALPLLLKWVTNDPPRFSFKSLVNKLPDAITPQPVRRWANYDFNRNRAMAAAFAFAQLGDDARSAIPQLTTAMTNSAATNASLRAIYALSSIGKAAIPALAAQIANTNLPNRSMLIHSFGRSPALVTNAAYATSAVPLLVACLDESDLSIAASAISALRRMAVHDPAQASLALPGLTNFLQGDFPGTTRIWAAVALGRYGTSASNAMPTLLAALADRDPQVRAAATNALLKVDPREMTFPVSGFGSSKSNAIPSLLAAMEDPNPLVRQRATNALLQIAPWEVTNFPTLVPMNSYFPGSAPPHQRGERP